MSVPPEEIPVVVVAPYVFALVDSAILLFLSIFYIVTLSDLECDYINAPTCCGRLNKVVIPEAVLVGLECVVLLSYGCFGSVAFVGPMFAWLIHRILSKPKSNIAFYDPAEIYNRAQLKTFTHEAIAKLFYYMLGFFLFLYSMIMGLVSSDSTPHQFPPPFPSEIICSLVFVYSYQSTFGCLETWKKHLSTRNKRILSRTRGKLLNWESCISADIVLATN